MQAFVLNFNGRVDKASVKNFQLIDEYDDNHIYMQFGRVGQQNFNMDVAYPCSLFQSFAIGLTSFDFKFACEWRLLRIYLKLSKIQINTWPSLKKKDWR